MTAYKEPFVAALWKEGSPEPFAFEELTKATDWDDAKKLAEEWAVENISLGGLAIPTLLYLKHAPRSELVKKWPRNPDAPQG